MKYPIYLILIVLVTFLGSCMDQEKNLHDRYIDLEEPQFFGDSVRLFKILKIHKKLYKRQPDNLIYFSNVFQTNCSLGKYEDNKDLIENSILPDDPDVNSKVYRNFYLALNEYQHDPKSDYHRYLAILLEEDLSHNPLLGYIAARCNSNDELADKYYPMLADYIYYMPEKNIIQKMIENDQCEIFLNLYRGICPMCEVCNKKYII